MTDSHLARLNRAQQLARAATEATEHALKICGELCDDEAVPQAIRDRAAKLENELTGEPRGQIMR